MRLIHGDCIEAMRELPDASVGAAVTDPPYDLTSVSRNGSPRQNDPATPYGRTRLGGDRGGFMGKTWDGTGIAFRVETWAEVLRLLKPGGYLVSFGGTRTYHRMACAIEDAGFIVKDSLHWLYGSGFPKSLNLGNGVGTALKPAHEPIVLAQKPLGGTYAANVARWGVGGLDVDGCRVTSPVLDSERRTSGRGPGQMFGFPDYREGERHNPAGRWPPNVLLTHSPLCADTCHPSCPVAALDRQSGECRSSGHIRRSDGSEISDRIGHSKQAGFAIPGVNTYNDAGGASRFYPTFAFEADDFAPFLYCAKASRRERGEGNTHPTVKPIALMRWLVRLVTPEGETVLDPFGGSGSTGVAAIKEGRDCILIEGERDYFEVAQRRIATAQPPLPMAAD